ncbi:MULTISPECIES: HlyD family secretion protein [Sphingobacterium]|jgi:HlyD family secretion protein|uniref:HlyD family secretion protein n=2 Tax=Sphingobacteriaceae TaxID=84566 RepID=UPI000C0BC0E9|nr:MULTISPECIES: biotin/lipoyl-binding protein [Sphingobacterium]MCT1533183.1 efflux RND transporter periplasmic adaptor subunit [Sphingobacterium daejeonense]
MKNILYTIAGIILLQSCSGDNQKKQIKLEGKIERDQIAVTTKIPGKIQKILVEAGQNVHKGDTLVILELPEVDAKAIQAEGALSAAQAQYEMAVKGATDGQMKQLHAKVDGLKEQYDFAQKSLDRMNNLLRDSLISQQKYDEVYAKYQGAKNQYLAAQAELADVQHGARIEQQRMALGQKERALGAVDEVNVAAKERYILAPQDMSIENINLQVGELAMAGYSLVSGYINDGTFFRVTIPESKIKDFVKGQNKTLIIPYLENKEVQAKVETIKPLSSYANISTAYPDFEEQETLFEVHLKPVNIQESKDLLTKATFIVKQN